MAVPDTLAARIALWREHAHVSYDRGELFTPASWIAVLDGQGPPPRSGDPVAAMLPVNEANRLIDHLRDVIGKTADAMPAHGDFIARHRTASVTRAAGCFWSGTRTMRRSVPALACAGAVLLIGANAHRRIKRRSLEMTGDDLSSANASPSADVGLYAGKWYR